MSVFSCYNPLQPWPIPPDWGDSTNFEWIPSTGKYWCKLCWKYSDDAHVLSKRHTQRKNHPQTYLWYLAENTRHARECLATVPPPPPGPPPHYLCENVQMQTQRKSERYELPVPAPPAYPPPSLDAASVRWTETQGCDDSVELLPSAYRNATKTITNHNDRNETLTEEPKKYVSVELDCTHRRSRWHRYAVDSARTAHWWWNPVHHDKCFCEDAPGAWCKYSDPLTSKAYWYLSLETWFWEDTGTMMC